MKENKKNNWVKIDQEHVWHPYNALPSKTKIIPVVKTKNSTIYLKNGKKLIDGMSSWWSSIQGYNNKKIVKEIKKQLDIMPHVMFGGLAHKQAAILAKKLVDLTSLNSVFFCDSGSVSVEVALKTAILYYKAKGFENKNKFLALEHSYHGDTLGAMSVCDPVNSMHSLYGSYLTKQYFTKAPNLGFNADYKESVNSLEEMLKKHHNELAAFIVEPVVQGAGGMRIYNPGYLKEAKKLCKKYNVLLITDEIATGFGHTGKMFACDHAGIRPDIMLLGKGITGGYLSMAAMLTTKNISDTISNSKIGALMHGPTFMANPTVCAAANANIDLLLKTNWQKKVKKIESIFEKKLKKASKISLVKNVRNIGAIGVIELKDDIYAQEIQDYCEVNGVWVRPFGKLLYSIVSYNIKEKELKKIIKVMVDSVKHIENRK